MVGCFKYVQKYKRLTKKTLERMTQYLLQESKDLSSFYSAEGELQNYLQRKIKKIHNTGKFLTKETNRKVKELLDLNTQLIRKLSRISERENKAWSLSSEIRHRGVTGNINYYDKAHRSKDQGNYTSYKEYMSHQEDQSKLTGLQRTTTSDGPSNTSLKDFLVRANKDNSSGVQKIILKLEKSYAELISIFVVFPKIIKNLQGLFEDKKEKSKYFDVGKRRKSKRLFFWRNPINQKTSFSYIQNIFQKLLGSFSKALSHARKVIFKTDEPEDLRSIRDTVVLDQSDKYLAKNKMSKSSK
jgi:hypothetical protein